MVVRRRMLGSGPTRWHSAHGNDGAAAAGRARATSPRCRRLPGSRQAKRCCARGATKNADIALAVPFYRSNENLSKQGDQFQWGGPMLCAERKFMTQDGKAHFQPVVPPGLGATPQIGFKRATTR